MLPIALGVPNGPELWIIILLVIVLFGAKRLPEIGRSLGEGIQEFKKASRKASTEDQDSKEAESKK